MISRRFTSQQVKLFSDAREKQQNNLFGLDADLNLSDFLEKEKEICRKNLFHVEKEDIGPFREFVSEYIILSASSTAYQIWRLIIMLLSFASSFYYAYITSRVSH